MREKFYLLIIFFLPQFCIGQTFPQGYYDRIDKADSLYDAKDFKASANSYTNAFKENGWKGKTVDRYNAACTWALAGMADSAFYYLNLIAVESGFAAFNDLTEDEDLISLHQDDRWASLLKIVKANKDKEEIKVNRPLARELDSIFNEDQRYRKMSGDIENKYGRESKEMMDLWKIIMEKDSMNLVRVKEILDTYGWLGADVVGKRGNSTLFLVIQHADLQTQEKYLPIMKQAVKDGKAEASSLALLIDRVEMRNKRPQIYGSQITFENNQYVIYPIIDEANVNKRRAEMGLEPLEKYVKNWDIIYKPPSE